MKGLAPFLFGLAVGIIVADLFQAFHELGWWR